jgi:hypothetical protein
VKTTVAVIEIILLIEAKTVRTGIR